MTYFSLLVLVVCASVIPHVNCLDCIFGAEYSANGIDEKVYKGELEMVSCPRDWLKVSCQRYEMNVTFVGGDQGPLIFGQCVPNGNCPYNTCSLSVPKIMEKLSIIASIDDCITGCCETDKCNQRTVAKIKASKGSAGNLSVNVAAISTIAFIAMKIVSSVK